MKELITVRFKVNGRQYFFDPVGEQYRLGEGLIVDTARGNEYGTVAMVNHQRDEGGLPEVIRPVVRRATEQDITVVEKNRQREKWARKICLEKIAQHKLDMKIVGVEFSFEGNKVLFFFTSDGRVDFRSLVKDLAAGLHARIELRQIGVRDESKMLGGLGICGRPFCCNQFLDKFQPVSIKMAKTQNLSLNPTKISGTCGRLMCCLKYEQDAYEDLLKKTPKRDSFVETPDGAGTITSINLLRQQLTVRLEDDPSMAKKYHNTEVVVVRSGRGKRPEGYVQPPLHELEKQRHIVEGATVSPTGSNPLASAIEAMLSGEERATPPNGKKPRKPYQGNGKPPYNGGKQQGGKGNPPKGKGRPPRKPRSGTNPQGGNQGNPPKSNQGNPQGGNQGNRPKNQSNRPKGNKPIQNAKRPKEE